MKEKYHNWASYICIIFAGIFIYGKYFVDITPIEKLSSTISAYMWILLMVLFRILNKMEKKDGI